MKLTDDSGQSRDLTEHEKNALHKANSSTVQTSPMLIACVAVVFLIGGIMAFTSAVKILAWGISMLFGPAGFIILAVWLYFKLRKRPNQHNDKK